MDIELKNCPFCDSDLVDIATTSTYYSGLSDTYVYCGECACEGPHIGEEESNDFETMEEYTNAMIEEAANRWNNRWNKRG